MIIQVEYDGKDIPVDVQNETALTMLKHIHHCQNELYVINTEIEIINRLVKECDGLHGAGGFFSQQLDTLHDKKENFLLSLYWLLRALGIAKNFDLAELYEKRPDKFITIFDINMLVDSMGEQAMEYFVNVMVTAGLGELSK